MVMRPFNDAWYTYLALLALFGIGLHLALRNRPVKVKRNVMLVVVGFNIILDTSFVFKSILDPNLPQMTLAQNLPFHLCDLIVWALIPAYVFDWRWLRAFCFFPGSLAALLTLTSPISVYNDNPVLSLPSLGFYGVHSLNVILGTLLATLGFYQPSWRDAVRATAHLVALALVFIFPLDAAMRAWVDPATNYFYLYDPEGADILIAMHKLVPIPVLYSLLVFPIALAGTLTQAAIYRGASRLLHSHRQPNQLPRTV